MIHKYIKRHSALTRFTHDMVAVTCILLAITGLFTFIPSLNNWAGADVTIGMRWAHRLIAIPFILIPILAILISPKGFVHLFKVDIFEKWDKDDYLFMKLFPMYLFFPSKVHMPPQREVKSGQRLADGILLFAAVFMAISGCFLWLNTGLLPGGQWMINFSQGTMIFWKWCHDICFVVIIVFGLAHAYLGAGIFEPYEGTGNLMFGNGYCTESNAVYHWGYWADVQLTLGNNVVEVTDGQPAKKAPAPKQA
ncbi:MAG: cytochrome b/b6 domain-containing protein [Burkholderiales bacterium]|nr:cytochrome b/b6 domain-containing protein [Burkholderiales bacterium]